MSNYKAFAILAVLAFLGRASPQEESESEILKELAALRETLLNEGNSEEISVADMLKVDEEGLRLLLSRINWEENTIEKLKIVKSGFLGMATRLEAAIEKLEDGETKEACRGSVAHIRESANRMDFDNPENRVLLERLALGLNEKMLVLAWGTMLQRCRVSFESQNAP